MTLLNGARPLPDLNAADYLQHLTEWQRFVRGIPETNYCGARIGHDAAREHADNHPTALGITECILEPGHAGAAPLEAVHQSVLVMPHPEGQDPALRWDVSLSWVAKRELGQVRAR